MDQQLLGELIDKYLAGKATPAEAAALLKWYDSVDHSEIVIPFESEREKDLTLMRMRAKIAAHAEANANVDGEYAEASILATAFSFRRVLRYTAAAAVVGILATGGFWAYQQYKNHKPDNVIATTPVTHDLLPGHEGAILTMAGGRQIILDSAADGQIALQGNGKVIKRKGLISYETAAATSPTVVYNTMTTPKGRQYQLVLPDGTRVWLNAASSITYPTAFTGAQREVTMTGEAYFEVVFNKKQPFRVKAGGDMIEDLGTHFNVNAYPDEPSLKTTLLEGSVRLNTLENSVLLKPGQQASSDPSGSIRVHTGIDMDETIAWKNGLFQFNKADIQTVMRQISRWYDVDVRFEGAIPNDRFWGKLPRDANASQVLQVLQKEQVHFRIEGKEIIVTQ